jgi:hypothetical protein
MVDKFERNAFVRLKANPNYWGGKPDFETVTIKFVTDAASRVAEVESGNAHVTLEMPYEEYDRLKGGSGIVGTDAPISDIGMIFLNDIDAMLDPNVRMAAAMRSTSSSSSTGCCRATALPSTRCRRRNTRPMMPRSRFPTIPRRQRNCWRLPATRRTTR